MTNEQFEQLMEVLTEIRDNVIDVSEKLSGTNNTLFMIQTNTDCNYDASDICSSLDDVVNAIKQLD